MSVRRAQRATEPTPAVEVFTPRTLRLTRALLVAGLFLLFWFTRVAHAHEYRPAVLVITAEPAERTAPSTEAELRFTPGTGDAALVSFTFDEGCDALLDRLRCDDDALLHVALRDPYGEQELVIELVDGGGRRATVVLTPDRPRAGLGTLTKANVTMDAAIAGPAHPRRVSDPFVYWLVTGIEHVWTGLDHLAFIVGLWLVAGSLRARVYAATAFTVGHSATLAFAVLGNATLPSGSVEACIALSVVLLAREGLDVGPPGPNGATPRRSGTDPRRPLAMWGIGFGLLHGLGFAGALQASGLGAEGRTLGLVAFNLGVEIGQIIVLLLCAAIAALAVTVLQASSALQVLARRCVAWALGAVAGSWFLERVWGVVLGLSATG